ARVTAVPARAASVAATEAIVAIAAIGAIGATEAAASVVTAHPAKAATVDRALIPAATVDRAVAASRLATGLPAGRAARTTEHVAPAGSPAGNRLYLASAADLWRLGVSIDQTRGPRRGRAGRSTRGRRRTGAPRGGDSRKTESYGTRRAQAAHGPSRGHGRDRQEHVRLRVRGRDPTG